MKTTGQYRDENIRDFRLFLQSELLKRCKANPLYSLRAYARSLRVSPSALSAILNGKRPLTEKTKVRLGLALGLSLGELKKFSHADSTKKGIKVTPTIRFQQLALDSYAVISDWYHYAILELLRVKSFKPESKWISKALGITTSEVNIAVERLQRTGLLKIENGSWQDTSQNGLATNIHDDLTSTALRKLQRQVLEKSITALETLPTSVRNHTSMTFAIDPDDLPEAKRKIAKFRRDLCEFFEKTKKPTQIYNLGVSLYPLTTISEGERK